MRFAFLFLIGNAFAGTAPAACALKTHVPADCLDADTEKTWKAYVKAIPAPVVLTTAEKKKAATTEAALTPAERKTAAGDVAKALATAKTTMTTDLATYTTCATPTKTFKTVFHSLNINFSFLFFFHVRAYYNQPFNASIHPYHRIHATLLMS